MSYHKQHNIERDIKPFVEKTNKFKNYFLFVKI